MPKPKKQKATPAAAAKKAPVSATAARKAIARSTPRVASRGRAAGRLKPDAAADSPKAGAESSSLAADLDMLFGEHACIR